MPVGAAIGGVAGAGASVFSGIMGSNAARDAASIQAGAARDIAQMQIEQANKTAAMQTAAGNTASQGILGAGKTASDQALATGERSAGLVGSGVSGAINYLDPYLTGGRNAYNSLAQLYGVATPGNPGGSGSPTPPVMYDPGQGGGQMGGSPGGSPAINQGWADFMNTPAYQFALQQGNLGLDRTAASKGLLLSGGQLKDAMSFNQGLASQQIGNYTNVLGQLAGWGVNAGNTAGNYLMSGGSQMANILQNAGQQSGGFLTGAAGGSGSALLQGAGLSGGTTMAGVNAGANTQMAGANAQASGVVGGWNALSGGVNNGIQNALLAYGMGKMPNFSGSQSSYQTNPTMGWGPSPNGPGEVAPMY